MAASLATVRNRTPNDSSSATRRRETRESQPERDGRVHCSAWLGPQNLVHRLPFC
jgi:hypothetical protein